MATSYWNPTSGNDSNDGLSVANAKLTIAAAESVAQLGGIVKITSGIHNLSGLVTFSGGRTYESENSDKTTLNWGAANGDRLVVNLVSTNKGVVRNLKILGLKYNTSAPIDTPSGTGDIDFISNEFDTHGDWWGGGQFYLGNSIVTGTVTFSSNIVKAYINRGSSSSFIFKGATNLIVRHNSFYITTLNDTQIHLNSNQVTNFTYDNNLFHLNASASQSINNQAANTLSRQGNIYFGDDGTFTLVNDEIREDPRFVGPENRNLKLQLSSPAIKAGLATNIPSDAVWVKASGTATIDGTEGEETNPYGFSEWATVISDANLTTSKSVVFSDGTYTFNAEFSNAYIITDLTFYGETRSGVTLTDGGGRLSGNGGGQNCRLRNLTIEALDHFFFNYIIELDATEVTFLTTKYILVSGSNHVFRACVFRVPPNHTAQSGWCLSGNTHFTNCTFIDLFGARSSLLTGGSLTNCIIYASLGTQTITMTTPPDESNTIFGIASGFGTANNSNPLFADPENNNLTLSPRSPLITSTSAGIPTDAVWIKASGTATVDGTEGQQTNAYGLSELTTAETTAAGRTSKTVVFKGEDFSTNAVIRLNTGNTDGMTYLAESDLTIFKATGETARFQVNSESAVKSTLKGITFKDYRTTSGNTYTARVGSDNNSSSLDNAGKVSWISCKFLDFSVTPTNNELIFGISMNALNYCYNECEGCEFSFLSTASQQGGVLGGQNPKHRMDATGCTFYVKAGTSRVLFQSNGSIPEYHLKSCIFYMESGTQVHKYYAALTHSSDGCTYFNSPTQDFTGVTNYRTDDPLLADKENNNFILSPKSPLLQ